MKDAPKSGVRAVDLPARAREVVSSLRALRGQAAELLEQLDAAIEDAETVAAGTSVGGSASAGPDAEERARLRVFRSSIGAIVCQVADTAGVALRDLLGPGAPPTAAAAAARDEAVSRLHASGLNAADIARVLRVSFEAARRRVAAKKAAA